MLYSIEFQRRLKKLIENSKSVVDQFKAGKITLEDAGRALQALEKKAFEEDKNAEPDGDYTYTVAIAMDEIRELDKLRPAPKKEISKAEFAAHLDFKIPMYLSGKLGRDEAGAFEDRALQISMPISNQEIRKHIERVKIDGNYRYVILYTDKRRPISVFIPLLMNTDYLEIAEAINDVSASYERYQETVRTINFHHALVNRKPRKSKNMSLPELKPEPFLKFEPFDLICFDLPYLASQVEYWQRLNEATEKEHSKLIHEVDSDDHK